MTSVRSRVAAACVVLFSVTAFLTMAATAYGTASEREVVHRYLSDALVRRAEQSPNVEWLPAEYPLVRAFSQIDEEKLGLAIDQAWQAHAAATATGQTEFLPDYFSGVALERATTSALSGFRNDTRMVVLDQTAKPAVFHLDGSVFQSEASAFVVRFALENDLLSAFDVTIDGTVTTFMNESSGWRVFSHERVSVEDPFIEAAGYEGGALAGINYYPAETPWFDFWPNFNPDLVAEDLELIKNLGANSVRVFLIRQDFLDPAVADANVESLKTLIALTERAGLKIIPTLFDLKPQYEIGSWADDVRYLKRVLPALRGANNLAFVDLKNEPDLDWPHHGEGLVEAWLRTMAAYIRQEAPGLPLTVGWSTAVAADRLVDMLDVISYHDYAPLAEATERLQALRDVVPTKAIMVTEIGASAWSGFAGYPGSQASQANNLAARLDALGAADGLMVWTLHDFPDPDVRVFGPSPWTRGLQSAFGLYDLAGNARASADVVREAFGSYLRAAEQR